jgi:hypothetical protein
VDNIPTEILQADPHLSAEMLYPLFLDIWKEERFSEDCKEGIIVKILKRAIIEILTTGEELQH